MSGGAPRWRTSTTDTTMKLSVPFLAGDAAAIAPGSECTVTLTDTGEVLTGTVTSVSNMDETITGDESSATSM